MSSRSARLTLLAIVVACLALCACSSSVPNRDPTGRPFPTVTGRSLAGEQLALPAAWAGAPAVVLVGYVQDAQFDLDRWLLGLLQLATPVARYELPTIPGLLPGLAAGWIDDGMRSGIPREDWGAVVTVYDDADPIVALTGNERPRNGRVLLLDADGVVRWFHDRGFSAGKAVELDRLARELADR